MAHLNLEALNSEASAKQQNLLGHKIVCKLHKSVLVVWVPLREVTHGELGPWIRVCQHTLMLVTWPKDEKKRWSWSSVSWSGRLRATMVRMPLEGRLQERHDITRGYAND